MRMASGCPRLLNLSPRQRECSLTWFGPPTRPWVRSPGRGSPAAGSPQQRCRPRCPTPAHGAVGAGGAGIMGRVRRRTTVGTNLNERSATSVSFSMCAITLRRPLPPSAPTHGPRCAPYAPPHPMPRTPIGGPSTTVWTSSSGELHESGRRRRSVGDVAACLCRPACAPLPRVPCLGASIAGDDAPRRSGAGSPARKKSISAGAPRRLSYPRHRASATTKRCRCSPGTSPRCWARSPGAAAVPHTSFTSFPGHLQVPRQSGRDGRRR